MVSKRRRTIGLQLIALAVGIVSGALAAFVHMPLPWMLGAMIGTTICSMAGVPMRSPSSLRPILIPILGVLLGSSLTMEVMRNALDWLPSILLMPFFIAAATLICMWIYVKFGKYTPASAFFASVPGGLNEMVLLSAAYGGDERKVAMAHGIRILLSICIIGIIYGLTLHVTSMGGNNWTSLNALTLTDYLWLGAAAVVGGLGGVLLRIPAGAVVVPMLLSGILHIAGLVTVAPPTVMVIAAQIVMGTTVGARFAGVKLRDILPDIMLGAIATIAMLGLAILFAVSVNLIVGTALSQSFLAFAPGGLSEMSLLALAMGQAVTYVTVLHITRILLVLLAAPHFYRLVRRKEQSE